MTKVENLENNKFKLTITIAAETFAKAIETAYHKNARQFNVPGFRKGKAPRRVIEQMYGQSVFYEDAFELCWGDAYDAALAEHAVTAVDKPEIDIETIGEKEGLVFTATVQGKPPVTLGKYKGIAVPRSEYTDTDAEVDEALASERGKQARYADTERTVAQDGDRVTLDYSGSADGVKFDGGTGEDQVLLIGSGTFIPGFEEQLVGRKIGEDCDVTVTFPEKYHAEELAGKEAVFACKIKAIQEKQLPEVDDEFIKDISEFDTVTDWKASKREELEKQKSERAKAARENAALKGACQNAKVDIPDCMIDRQVEYMLRDLAYRLQGSGLSLEDYCMYTGSDVGKLKESYHADALERVKTQLVVEAVAKKEKLTAASEEIAAKIDEYAEGGKVSREEFESKMSADDREYVEDRIVFDKAIALITDSAVEE